MAGKKIYDLIDQEKSRSIKQEKGATLAQVHGTIEFRNVAFAYPSRLEKTVFSDLNLTIPAGHRVGLVGESGSGKSTITQLILRFYEPVGGTVNLDGVDIKTLDLKWYRSNIGLISQEPTLFATSILENVRFGRPAATDEEVYEACRAANAHDFIMEFPDQYNTFAGGSGMVFSGGQRQRICVARSFLRKPRLLICDEATSALEYVIFREEGEKKSKIKKTNPYV